MRYTAKHNTKSHTVTVHSSNCSCVASGSIWVVEAATVKDAVEQVKIDEDCELRGIKVKSAECAK